MNKTNEKKEPKNLVTRMTHKIQKTLGGVTSKNDVLDNLPSETLHIQLKSSPSEPLPLPSVPLQYTQKHYT